MSLLKFVSWELLGSAAVVVGDIPAIPGPASFLYPVH